MACSGSYCGNHCLKYGCSVNRGPRSGNPYSFSALGEFPTAQFTNELRSACNQELAARKNAKRISSSSVAKDSTIIAKTGTVQILTDLKNCINAMKSGYITTTYNQGTYFTKAQWIEIRDKILALMRECLCNGDCGGNQWCSCYGDCGCNY